MNKNNNLQKFGGIAALYMAIAHLIGIIIFLVILDYPNITEPALKMVLNIDKRMIIFSSNLLMYVFFGFALIVLSLALFAQFKTDSLALNHVATVVGVIWAGSLIASGMIANAGLSIVSNLYTKDFMHAVLIFQTIETIANGLGNANGEILGGAWTLMVSLTALQINKLHKALNILGLLVGAVGIISLIPAANPLVGIFGLGQIIWFIWLGIALLRGKMSIR